MTAKTYDKQTAKFLAVVGENMPELSGDVMQGWIQNPKAVQKVLERAFCPPEISTVVSVSSLVSIDRTSPFDPVKLLGQGWNIEEQDERSLALDQVNLANVRLEHMLKKGENRVQGEEKLKRLKGAGYIRPDARIFQTLWENQSLIPESWKKKTNGNTTYIFFDGTVLRSPDGRRCVLFLYWRGGRWDWGYGWRGFGWLVGGPSAVLASI